MPILYSVYKNKLKTAKPGDYFALTHSAETIDQAGLVELIMDHNSSLTEGDILSVFSALNKVVPKAIKQGKALNLPLIAVSFSISGKFSSEDSFTKGRNNVNLKLTRGPLLRNLKLAKPKKTNVPEPNLAIQKIKNVDGVLEVKGFNIKIDGGNVACGLWLVGPDKTETRVTGITENNPSRIIARIPDLDHGNYQVKVVTQYTNGSLLKMPREHTLKDVYLTI